MSDDLRQEPVRVLHPAEARVRVLRSAVRVLAAQLAEEHAMADAEAQYANEQLALAARGLVDATSAMDPGDQPALVTAWGGGVMEVRIIGFPGEAAGMAAWVSQWPGGTVDAQFPQVPARKPVNRGQVIVRMDVDAATAGRGLYDLPGGGQ